MNQNKTASRILYSLIALICMTVIIFLFSSVISYFNSSTKEINKYDVGLNKLAHHTPDIKWLKDDADIKGEINPFIRKEIVRSYSDAWGILNLSIKHKKDLGLRENFSDIKTKQLANNLNGQDSIMRKDLSHNLKLHFISLDKQVISFSDFEVVEHTEIKIGDQVISRQDTNDYKILMTLDDGKWRVNKMIRI